MSKKATVTPAAIISVATGWEETLLICRKCSKKLSGGFGKNGDETLKTALRARLREIGRRQRTGIIEVDCFGICPKKAVVIACSSRPGSLLIVGARADPKILIN